MDKDIKAISFIRSVEKASKVELFAGNSGGKDSAVLIDLLKRSGIQFKSYHTNTTIDPKGTLSHIRKYYPETEILQPKETFYQLVERKGLPTRLMRYCCEFLKEYGSIGKSVFEGVRSAESRNRQGRDYVQCDNRSWQNGAKHIYPLYDWSDADIWAYIKEKNIILAPAYSNGCNRLGCVGCPIVTKKGQRKKEFDANPKIYQAIKRAIEKGMKNNPQWKISIATNNNSQLAMDWWLSGKTIDEYFTTTEFIKNNKVWVAKEKRDLFNSV